MLHHVAGVKWVQGLQAWQTEAGGCGGDGELGGGCGVVRKKDVRHWTRDDFGKRPRSLSSKTRRWKRHVGSSARKMRLACSTCYSHRHHKNDLNVTISWFYFIGNRPSLGA